MQATIDPKAFRRAVTTAARGAQKASSQEKYEKLRLPILAWLLLEAGHDTLSVIGTNLDVMVRCTVPAVVSEPGAWCGRADVLQGIADTCTSSELRLTEDRRGVVIKSDGSAFRMNTISVDEFPLVPRPPEAWALEVPAAAVIDALGRAEYAAAEKSDVRVLSREVLTGVHIRKKGAELLVAASDGTRAVRHHLSVEADGSVFAHTVPPLGAILQAFTTDEGATFRVCSEHGNVMFSVGDTIIAVRPMLHPYVDIEQCFTPRVNTSAHVARLDLLRVVRLAKAIGRRELGQWSHDLEMDLTEDGIALSAMAPDVGSARLECHARVEGRATHLDFDGRYLEDALCHIATAEVVFEIDSPRAPVTLRPVGLDHEEMHVFFARNCRHGKAAPAVEKPATEQRPSSRRRSRAAAH